MYVYDQVSLLNSPFSMLSLFAFFAKIRGTPYFSAQIVARAMPLASAVKTQVIEEVSKYF